MNIASKPKFLLVKLLKNTTNKSINLDKLQNDLFYLEPMTAFILFYLSYIIFKVLSVSSLMDDFVFMLFCQTHF
jgi:hypothetical protein